MKKGRLYVTIAAIVAAAMYGVTGVVYLTWSAPRGVQPITIWWATLWFVGGSAVAAAGIAQSRAKGWGRVFALSVLAFLAGAALAAEALGLAIASDSISGDTVPALVHPIGFALSWPVFLLALVEDVFAVGER